MANRNSRLESILIAGMFMMYAAREALTEETKRQNEDRKQIDLGQPGRGSINE